jgi:uncharacterized radical SAM superfamily Fe-S cluster-containing enzyme
MTTCIDAFKNIYIESRNNQIYIAPCCVGDRVKVDHIDFHHSHLEKIRESWSKSQSPIECSYCKNAEKNNLNSRREGSNNWYLENGFTNNNIELIRIDYWVGDTCNLACLICGPHNSSRWKQEKGIPIVSTSTNINKTWKDLDLKNLKFIHFNGGEPILSKEHITFLENIPNPADVSINYNTNGTVLPSEKLIRLWEKFKLIQIDFSIDDIEERFELQRYPAKWDEVILNLAWFYKHSPVNCMFSINTTISILNQNNIKNIKKWASQNFSVNRLSDPVEHRFQLAAGIFAINTARNSKANIINFLNKLDLTRNTDWRQILPDVAEFLISTQ